MGGAAPSFGMFGTLFGLVVMLGQLENPSEWGLAAALITTLYGISLARFLSSCRENKECSSIK